LYVRKKDPRVRLEPQIDGGGHERGMRSGTLPVPMIVALGTACEIARREMPTETERTFKLRERLRKGIMNRLPESYLNGHPTERLPGNANISFAYVEGEGLMMGIKDVAVSSGSACTSASLEPSYVLRALGVGDELAHSSIRFGLGRFKHRGRSRFRHRPRGARSEPAAGNVPAVRDGAAGNRYQEDRVGGPLTDKGDLPCHTATRFSTTTTTRATWAASTPRMRPSAPGSSAPRVRRRHETANPRQPETGLIEDAKFKTFGCGSAIASSSLATEWLKGKTVDEAMGIKNTQIVEELALRR